MLRCSFKVDPQYAEHLHVYPYYMARIANREPIGTYWAGYGAGHEADEARFYEYTSNSFADLPEWTLVSSEYSMYYPEPWELVGNPDAPNTQTGFCGWVPFYAKLDTPIEYGSPSWPKDEFWGFSAVYNLPDTVPNESIPCTDLTHLMTDGWDPVVFTSYTGPDNIRGPIIQKSWTIYPKYQVRIMDTDGNDLPNSCLWGSWSFNGYGSIVHINPYSLANWYSNHGDRISAYIQPLDADGVPVTNETILEDWFPGFGPHHTHSWKFLEHSQSGAVRPAFEFMRMDLNGYGRPDLGFRVGVRLKKADGTLVGLRGLHVAAEYNVAASDEDHPDVTHYNPWVKEI